MNVYLEPHDDDGIWYTFAERLPINAVKQCVVCQAEGPYWCAGYCHGYMCHAHFMDGGHDASCARCYDEGQEGP